ncbi:putative defensin-like protein 67 [Arabidopsis lyrata subsp. lyrata]|nr:putative defensin-like protein 67 [Arabidopsis lyrata subsp. lyrata]|eukprot:XP_002880671.2 putative defensin-like protein 67 [Arabidopsis lyrata subsp. lyrata]
MAIKFLYINRSFHNQLVYIKSNLRNIQYWFVKMGSSKLMVTCIVVAILAISCDILSVEMGISVQALPPTCGPDCTGTFLKQDCYKYCAGLSYKHGVCILFKGLPPRTSTYRCCCG